MALTSLSAVLAASGASLETVCRLTVLVAAAADIAPALAVVRERFPAGASPTVVTAYAVAGLPVGAKAEIEAVAALASEATVEHVDSAAATDAKAATNVPVPAMSVLTTRAAAIEAVTVPPKCPFARTAYYLGRPPAPKGVIFTEGALAGSAESAAHNSAAAGAETARAAESALAAVERALLSKNSSLLKALKLTVLLAPAADAETASEVITNAVWAAARAAKAGDEVVELEARLAAPAVTVMTVAALPQDALVQIDAIAAR